MLFVLYSYYGVHCIYYITVWVFLGGGRGAHWVPGEIMLRYVFTLLIIKYVF